MAAVLRRGSSTLGSVVYSFLTPKQYSKPQAAGMISKALRDDDYKRPPAFPYKERNYSLIATFFDKTLWRFDENTKILVVDGPVASGKAKLAEKIAEEFDLHYIPHANMEHLFVNQYGYDLRTLNDKMPPKLRSYEAHDFHANPYDERSAMLQMSYFQIRLSQYLDALAHILSTGQGVVLNRSVFSDCVFLETHLKFGFLPETLRKHYKKIWDCIKPDVMRPHLIIYIDTPVDVVRENLIKRNDPVLIKSPALQPEVLNEFERVYKQKFLKQISTHAELLVYDGSKDVDPEIVVEDIERVNLDNYERYAEKMSDWRLQERAHDDWAWAEKRLQYTRDRDFLEIWVSKPCFDCPEIMLNPEDALQHHIISQTLPGNKYVAGYNADMGDANILFKI